MSTEIPRKQWNEQFHEVTFSDRDVRRSSSQSMKHFVCEVQITCILTYNRIQRLKIGRRLQFASEWIILIKRHFSQLRNQQLLDDDFVVPLHNFAVINCRRNCRFCSRKWRSCKRTWFFGGKTNDTTKLMILTEIRG